MALVEVKTDFGEVKDLLGRFRAVGGNFAPIMQVVAEMLVSAVSDRYQSEGDGQWPAHAPATVARMGPHALMQYKGILSGSTAADWSESHAEAYTSVDYVKYHLEGGSKIPKRNPFEVNDSVFDDAEGYIMASVIALLEAA